MEAEKRLIYMDDTMDELRAYADRKHAAGHNDLANGILKAASYIRNNMVRVDAVPVVRCKNCMYWDPDPDTWGDGNGPRGHCHGPLDDTMEKTALDDFCSWGERRADHGKD